jgi:hypothetical protein
MTAKTHDRIIVESQKVGQPVREGEVLEIIEASYGTRYRVAWDDGHESTLRPSGSARIVPAAKVATTRKKALLARDRLVSRARSSGSGHYHAGR